ncbi:unnamed protein product [Rangifer tarandus platyrhynchus]|uniref:Uncharacterized protein n=1 Tax=Rangifer tarandus platyrhynchus TaxID=3082113 RepID=A0AC59Z6G1_RANTA
MESGHRPLGTKPPARAPLLAGRSQRRGESSGGGLARGYSAVGRGHMGLPGQASPVSPDPRPFPQPPLPGSGAEADRPLRVPDLSYGNQERLDAHWSLSDPRLDGRPPGLAWREHLGCPAPGPLRGSGLCT